MTFTKILIIASQIPQTIHAGSLQFYRVLEQFPSENLRAIGPIEKEAHQLCKTYDPFILTTRFTTTRFCELANSLNTIKLLPDISVSKIDELLGEFKPDLVITLMETLPYSYAAHRYALKKRLPLLTVSMDKPGDFTRIYQRMKPFQFKRMKSIYKYASVNLGVSFEMAAYLSNTYNIKSDTLYFCPPEGLTARNISAAAKLKNEGELTIGYAGSMTLGYGKQIESMLTCFEKSDVHLNIYSHQEPSFKSPCVNYRGKFTQYEVWDKIKDECDAVILPYYFHYGTKETSVYSTHFPTKLSEYLTLGMPVIVIGPEWATGMKWAKAHPEAVISSSNEDPLEWSDIFKNIRNNPEVRLAYSIEPVKAQKKEFSTSIIKNQFLQFINQAISKS